MSDDQSENNRALGRPSGYKPEYAQVASELCENGATMEELAFHFDVCIKTIYNWKNNHQAFLHAINVNKKVADDEVVRSLYQKAVGYTKADGTRVPGDTTAQIFWLKNRRPEDWRDKVDFEPTASEGNPLMNVLKDIANQGLGLNNGGDE